MFSGVLPIFVFINETKIEITIDIKKYFRKKLIW